MDESWISRHASFLVLMTLITSSLTTNITLPEVSGKVKERDLYTPKTIRGTFLCLPEHQGLVAAVDST